MRSGIPIDTLTTAPTLREAAQRVIDETTVQDSVHGGSVAIVPYGAIEDLENCLATTTERVTIDLGLLTKAVAIVTSSIERREADAVEFTTPASESRVIGAATDWIDAVDAISDIEVSALLRLIGGA